MANHQVPRKAKRIERHHGIDARGNVVALTVYRHVRQGHTLPMFYVVGYREASRKIVASSRVTREFTGPDAEQAMRAEVDAGAKMLEATREAYARKVTVSS
jgi:hypothetical protein